MPTSIGGYSAVPVPRPGVPKPAPSPEDYAELVGHYVNDTNRLKRAIKIVGVAGSLVGLVVGVVIGRREEDEK